MIAVEANERKSIGAGSSHGARKTVHRPTGDGLRRPKLITRIHKPANLESNFSSLGEANTPDHNVFVRDHFPVPKIIQSKWRLQIDGAVTKTLSLSLKDLKAMPSVTHTSVLECAGNGRMFLPNVPEGVQWGQGAVGCVAWTGVSLRDVLALAGVQPDAVEIVLQGADHGTPEKHLKPKDEINFARSLPLAAAQRPEVLLAYEMNGRPLAAAHGAPVRIVVPGWYSVAAVKWLTRIEAVRAPFRGYFQTVEYAYWKDDGTNPPERIPITELFLKSQISRPSMNERVPAGKSYQVSGAAWAAEHKIKSVEVSTDGGKTWEATSLKDSRPTTLGSSGNGPGSLKLRESIFLCLAPRIGVVRFSQPNMTRTTKAT
jgi:DMSO/TMAO reductase YedYZ molybdopterin-dependent catalytic subunit